MNVVDSYAASALARDPEQLVAPILRLRSVTARAVLAWLASGGECADETITTALADANQPPAATLADADRRRWLSQLARVLAAQQARPTDAAHALALYEAIVDAGGCDELDATGQAWYAQLLYHHAKYAQLASVLPQLGNLRPIYRRYLRIDLANPFVRSDADEATWLTLLNEPLTEAGLEPVELSDDGAIPFDRLAAPVDDTVEDGPLVSVIMSAYRPDDALPAAVRSILNQTWRQLELIIVDDASGSAYDDRFAAVAALDDRVRVIRADVNQGTYVARNTGLAAATGEIVTFQDSDDWSHPRRIELQVSPLLNDPTVIGTRSLAVRATDTLSHQWLGYPAQRVNASSLMFRRAEITDRLGTFDPVRKSADFEFAFRMEAAFGREITDVPQPLAYTRLRQSSLSRADFTPGWAAPARIAYQAAYFDWHRAIGAGASGATMAASAESRPFPPPPAYVRGIAAPPAGRDHYDVLLVDDWVSFADGVDGGIEQIAILTAAGYSVGIVHAETLARMSSRRRHVDPQLQRLINDGAVDRVTLDQDVHASLVLVRDPAVLQFGQDDPAAVRADQVLISPIRDATEYPGLDLAYDEQECLRQARALFGGRPRWAADLDPAPIDLGRWARPRTRRRSSRPVLGQAAPEAAYIWPATPVEQLTVYPPFGELDVRVLAGSATAARLRRRKERAAWLLYHRDQISLRAFLNQLDFFVCFPGTTSATPALDLVIAALASGAVVVLPHRYANRFGDAAVYCDPADVAATVHRLYADPAAYTAQVDAGRRYVAEHHDATSFRDHIAAELATEAAVPGS